MSLRTLACLRPAAILALAASVLLPALAAGPIRPNDDILGQWRITRMLDASNVTALDDRQAARLVGKLFVVEPGMVSMDGEVCDEPEFTRHYEDAVRYLREDAHASSWKLGLPLTVTVIDLSCTEALVKGHDHIVVLWKGVFFDAVKRSPGLPGQAK
ncbi:hypothetical protein ABIB38_002434 [Massilia sp. UYP11]|uniref:hypothetical protein n=1 Tax=Massilia sp. UYP11 TaxID=1756385 RepID=UPI003D1A078A